MFMKNTFYFVLLTAIFCLSNTFAREQLEEKLNQRIDTNESRRFLGEIEKFERELNQRADINESPNFLNESDSIKKKLEQDLPNSVQEKSKLDFPDNNTVELNNLNPQEKENEKVDDEEKQHTETKLPKAASEEEENDKDLPEHLLEKSEDKVAKSQQGGETIKNLEAESPSSSTSLNESTTDLHKDSKAEQKEENELLDSNISQSLEKKENAPKIESQIEEKNVNSDSKDRNGKNRAKPITKREKKDELKEDKNSQELTNLQKESIKKHKQRKSIYKRQYDSLNEHLPTTIFIDDYSKQLFYCIKNNNLSCLRGVMSKLEAIGLTTQEILEFRNKFGDTPLIYAVKKSEIDTVRFLLLQGADLRVVDHKFRSPISIAIERKEIDIINAIAEMTLHLLEERKISNKESSEMYNWTIKMKEDTCGENQTK
jgi:chemotaxis protein histidine kinase CheA